MGTRLESTRRELSNECQHDRVKMVFKNVCNPCAFDESSLSIARVNPYAAGNLNLTNTNLCKKCWKMTETLANRYSSESTQRELYNKYQHNRVKIIFIIFCFLVHWTKVTPALEGLSLKSNNMFCYMHHCKKSSKPLGICALFWDTFKYMLYLADYNFQAWMGW